LEPIPHLINARRDDLSNLYGPEKRRLANNSEQLSLQTADICRLLTA